MGANDESDGRTGASALEVSVVMPCLNESDTVATCIEKALRSMEEHGIEGEIVLADNGSTDGSQEIAAKLGARVVPVEARGYGAALMGGIAAARAPFVIMGDADDSYDFLEIPRFVEKYREGYELVQGCRLPSGGGTILPGAMPFLHRWVGNPLFSMMARRWFRAPIHDVYCGLRGFRADLYERLNQRCTGMEFATEMIIKCGLFEAKTAEVPITLHPDGRKAHAPHLKTFRDGWRTLRFLLIHSPRWLFLIPGLILVALGLVGYAIALPGVVVGGIRFDAHTLLFAALAIISGYMSMLFGVFSKQYAITGGLLPPSRSLDRLFRVFTIERGILVGAVTLVLGLVLLVSAFVQWKGTDFGDLDYSRTMRWVIPGVTLTTLGLQTMLASFFLGVLRMPLR